MLHKLKEILFHSLLISCTAKNIDFKAVEIAADLIKKGADKSRFSKDVLLLAEHYIKIDEL